MPQLSADTLDSPDVPQLEQSVTAPAGRARQEFVAASIDHTRRWSDDAMRRLIELHYSHDPSIVMR